jgi:hypothetical protein
MRKLLDRIAPPIIAFVIFALWLLVRALVDAAS